MDNIPTVHNAKRAGCLGCCSNCMKDIEDFCFDSYSNVPSRVIQQSDSTQKSNTDSKVDQKPLESRSSRSPFVSFNQNDPGALKQIGDSSDKEK